MYASASVEAQILSLFRDFMGCVPSLEPASIPVRFLPHVRAANHDTLEAMQQAVASSSVSTFAATLASLAASPAREPIWNDDGLEDDVAIFSYERALQGRAQLGGDSSRIAPAHAERDDRGLSITEVDEPELPVQDRKRASITIRLSETECAQLRARAAESGMTVSAYLRSCTLEVESLRAQVKEALAQLRPGLKHEMSPAPWLESSAEFAREPEKMIVRGESATKQSSGRWFEKIWPRSRTAPQAA